MKKKNIAIYYLVLSSLMAALTAAAAQISFFVSAIPFSASIIAVMLCGFLLPPSYATLSMLCYLALGAAGLPVFAGFSGGIARLLSATGGFLFSYPLMALLISTLSRKTKLPYSIISLLSLPICYALGASFFALVSQRTLIEALSVAVTPFIPLDIVKCVLTALCWRLLKKALKL